MDIQSKQNRRKEGSIEDNSNNLYSIKDSEESVSEAKQTGLNK